MMSAITDWAEPLILARKHLRTAEACLTLSRELNDSYGREAQLELCEARDKINDALAAIRGR